jgi:hypothetical protein
MVREARLDRLRFLTMKGAFPAAFLMERTGIEPVTSSLQS